MFTVQIVSLLFYSFIYHKQLKLNKEVFRQCLHLIHVPFSHIGLFLRALMDFPDGMVYSTDDCVHLAHEEGWRAPFVHSDLGKDKTYLATWLESRDIARHDSKTPQPH